MTEKDAPEMHNSGLRYCIVHDGVIDIDQSCCDFQHDADEDGECKSHALFYFTSIALGGNCE